MSVKYRPDVDGLRALAVVPVVLYHYGVPGFAGGYVGVDVFFVISGFLITSLIESEIGGGRFSLVHFYERRVRRIFPALFALLFVTAALAFTVLFPRAFVDYAKTVAATAGFLSNLAFWWQTGYFDVAAHQKPLLHTWSLAVEEQFYLLFPPLMILIARLVKGRYTATLLPLFAASFVFSAWGALVAPSFAFYLLPARMWELLLGSLIAVGALGLGRNEARAAGAAALGIAMIACSVTLFTSRTPFPGVAALLPCVGAGLIIVAGQSRLPPLNRLLSREPIVFIGKISYSLYLWHWPLYVFARDRLARELTALETVVLIGVSTIIAMLSWRAVEQPFRRRDGVFARPALFAAAGTAIAASVAIGAAVHVFKGVPQRFDPQTLALLAPSGEASDRRCPAETHLTSAGPLCRIGSPSAARLSFLVWGDSHARALMPAVAQAAERFGHAGLAVVQEACPPLLGANRSDSRDQRCRRHNDDVRAYLRSRDIPVVILIARWAINAEGTRYGEEERREVFLEDDESRDRSRNENRRVFERTFARTIRELRAGGHRVVVVGPIPEIGRRVPETLARDHMLGASQDIGPTLAAFEARNKFVLGYFQAHADDAEYVYPHRLLCSPTRCAVAREGKPLYSDDNHLSRFGAQNMRPLFEPLFAGGAGAPPRAFDLTATAHRSSAEPHPPSAW